MNEKLWSRSVNGTTIFWLGLFFVGLFAFDSDLLGFEEPLIIIPEELEAPWEIISWIIWIIFVVDVYFKYRKSENWRAFLRNHWFDILLIIPFFRILRIFRLLRLLKTMKFSRIGIKAVKYAIPPLESGYEIKSLIKYFKDIFKKSKSSK